MKAITPADHVSTVRELHPSQFQSHIRPVAAPLHVIAVISNPMRFESRYRLYRAFEKHVHESGAILTTVELALGDRAFEVTCADNPRHLQLRSPTIMWLKENMINLGLRHLATTDPDFEYVAWIDADVSFMRHDWAVEAVHLLQTYKVVQMWTHALDLGPHGQPIKHMTSFVHDWLEGDYTLKSTSTADLLKTVPLSKYGLTRHHTGFAWAARRSVLADIGGLGDAGIMGAGDHHMAHALIDQVDKTIPQGLPASYGNYWRAWQHRADIAVTQNIGVMGGTIMHGWHGRKIDRRYWQRWDVLTRNQFDYPNDVHHDIHGLLAFNHNKPKLERDCRRYFELRDEDATGL